MAMYSSNRIELLGEHNYLDIVRMLLSPTERFDNPAQKRLQKFGLSQ